MNSLEKQIAWAERRMTALAKENGEIRRLCTAPGVGPVTATSLVAHSGHGRSLSWGAPSRGVPRARPVREELG